MSSVAPLSSMIVVVTFVTTILEARPKDEIAAEFRSWSSSSVCSS
jgi:hypothetical protein